MVAPLATLWHLRWVLLTLLSRGAQHPFFLGFINNNFIGLRWEAGVMPRGQLSKAQLVFF